MCKETIAFIHFFSKIKFNQNESFNRLALIFRNYYERVRAIFIIYNSYIYNLGVQICIIMYILLFHTI